MNKPTGQPVPAAPVDHGEPSALRRYGPLAAAGCVAALPALLLGLLIGWSAHSEWERIRPPEPTPAPAPVEGHLWVTLIYDADNPGTTFARMESDPGLKSGIEKLGGTLRKFVKDSPSVDKEGFRPAVDKFGTPTLIIEAEGSSKVFAEACPKTAPEVIEAARKFKGGKK